MGEPPPTHQQHPIVCRCCLSEEEEDQIANFLPLYAAAATNFRETCKSNNDEPAVGESSITSLLDCLNGCARIGATLEDTSLPLHICLDCCQALEACCEFIRCVQNADKILRCKQQSRQTTPKRAAAVDEKVDNLKAATVEMGESLSIGTLSLLDIIEDSQLPIVDFGNALVSSKSDSQTAHSTLNDEGSEQTLINIEYLEHPCNAIKKHDFDFASSTPLLFDLSQNSNNEIAKATNDLENEISEFLNLKASSNTKHCGNVSSTAQILHNAPQNAIPDTHKFIPPFVKDKINYKASSTFKKSFLATDFAQKQKINSGHSTHIFDTFENESVKDVDDVIFLNNNKSTIATLLCNGRKFIVNAKIVDDLKKFHKDNQDTSKYLCMFCIYMCNSQQALDQHLVTHLGSTRYSCMECSFKCRFQYYLNKHLKRAHKRTENMEIEIKKQNALQSATKFYCSICRRYFSSLNALQKHDHNEEEPFYKCTHCDTQESLREPLLEHLARDHKVFIDVPLIDSYIPKLTKTTVKNSNAITYQEETFLSQFVKEKQHSPHTCKFCGRNFKRRFYLQKHEYFTHSKNNKKENDNYYKRRTTKSARNTMSAKNIEHQFNCDKCRRIFLTQVELIEHVQEQHSCIKFECATCKAVFTFEFELKYHMRTHNASNASTSPRSEYFAPEYSTKASTIALKKRLHRFKQLSQQPRILSNLSSLKRKTIPKRRLSLASVSTAKSSEEGSLNSTSNANSDEEISLASNAMSIKHESQQYSESGSFSISMADVMLPQPLQQRTGIILPNTSPSVSTNMKFRATSPIVAAQGPSPFFSSCSSCQTTDKQMNCDSNDQTYLKDFDLNLLDYSDDFWLDLYSF